MTNDLLAEPTGQAREAFGHPRSFSNARLKQRRLISGQLVLYYLPFWQKGFRSFTLAMTSKP